MSEHETTVPAGGAEKIGTVLGLAVLAFVYLGILWMMARAIRIL
jgi:hypothetical protein